MSETKFPEIPGTHKNIITTAELNERLNEYDRDENGGKNRSNTG